MRSAGADVPPFVIVDCDPGIDDALALLMLARAHQAGHVIIDSVFAVRGNVAVAQTASNAASVLERAGISSLLIVRGAGAPLAGTPKIESSISIHGKDGLGGLASEPRTAPRASANPGEDLARRILGCAEPPILLASGPLTNLALALGAEPAVAQALSRVVIMGGALGNPPGNITPVAEFNFYQDPVAASIVVGSGLPIELVTLDVTESIPFVAHDLVGLSTFPRTLLTESLRLHQEAFGLQTCYVHDAIAAAIVLDPSLAHLSPAWMTVATAGDDAGHVELSPKDSGSLVKVVSELDGVRTKELLHSLLDATEL
jgi:inosine-uridine nucleoside N-ribohydrolase